METAESYLDAVKKAGILIDMQERKAKILRDSNLLARSVGGHLTSPGSLLLEVVNLVEAPLPILGQFDASFLELPEDILTTVANGVIKEEVVRKGNEAVLRARYEDAKFFYKMDTQKKFSEFRSQLNGILFHEKLGTMLDKMERVQKIVAKLGLALGIDERMIPVIKDAAAIAMSDLATSIVTEFTSLAGIMARHYALKDGYPELIAEALFEIMLPRFSGDILPKSDAGIVLAVADRLDSLVGLFGAGCQPSSTNDPFGLRRISYGLVQILTENKKNLDLRSALTLVVDVQPIEVDANIINEVSSFSIRIMLETSTKYEIIWNASTSTNYPETERMAFSNHLCQVQMEALSRTELFPKVVEVYSRPTRIIRGKDIDNNLEVSSTAFEKDEEQALWSAYLEVSTKIHPGVDIELLRKHLCYCYNPLKIFQQCLCYGEDKVSEIIGWRFLRRLRTYERRRRPLSSTWILTQPTAYSNA
ncbi:Glycine--tRNA ligase, chloroplastic/mitochondrial 2 [Ananas comosus]|uniref:glycine--tRNA ligase n=1 Tax=Ananas comosus TaxID=4615 RepID=A0A199VEU4_ANACO|nr:Glycine--tRNA ligase, chloroplastic/mitochondrial 2 [Ananas comosus]